MKKGIVLEGGAMRGMFSAGVTDVLMENGVEFDGCVGTSAGGIVGCNIKSRQIGRTIRYNKKFCKDPRYASIRNLIFTGDLYSKKFAYRDIPEKLDVFDTKTFRENPMEFYVCCTDVVTGKPVYHRCEDGGRDDITWMRASASMPIASKVVKIDGFDLLDGGITDAVPLKFMESMGYDKNVVILTQPKSYKKGPSSLIGLTRMVHAAHPKVAQLMKVRPKVYNENIAYIQSRFNEGACLVIQPDSDLNIGKIERDENQLQRVYDLGREMGVRMLDKVKEYLK